MPRSNDPRNKHKYQSAASRQEQIIPNQPGDERIPHDESVRRSRRYYDDSDDMINRVRRVRAAFEKRINGFQGADWPHYVKRTIVGKRKVEESSTQAQTATTGDNVRPKTSAATLPFSTAPGKERE